MRPRADNDAITTIVKLFTNDGKYAWAPWVVIVAGVVAVVIGPW
jgi:hypothetical protein